MCSITDARSFSLHVSNFSILIERTRWFENSDVDESINAIWRGATNCSFRMILYFWISFYLFHWQCGTKNCSHFSCFLSIWVQPSSNKRFALRWIDTYHVSFLQLRWSIWVHCRKSILYLNRVKKDGDEWIQSEEMSLFDESLWLRLTFDQTE